MLFQAPLRATLVTRRATRCVDRHLAPIPAQAASTSYRKISPTCFEMHAHDTTHTHTQSEWRCECEVERTPMSRHHRDAMSVALSSYVRSCQHEARNPISIFLRERRWPQQTHPITPALTAPIMTVNGLQPQQPPARSAVRLCATDRARLVVQQ